MEADARRRYERWLYELWTTADRQLGAELVTDDFVGHWPDRTVHGVDGLVAITRESLSLFTDVTTSTDVGPVVDGDLVAAEVELPRQVRRRPARRHRTHGHPGGAARRGHAAPVRRAVRRVPGQLRHVHIRG